MDKPTSWVVIGRIGAAYGLKGWLKLHSFTQPTENILNYQDWYVKHSGSNESWRLLPKPEVRWQNNILLVHIPGCSDRESTAVYVNADIGVLREQLAELKGDEYYWHDLEGCSVINQDDVMLGQVAYVLETGANEVLVVKAERERLIPYILEETILAVDIQEKIIRVRWDPDF